ncbi:hypothetical protein ACFWNQ_02375 [Streptomyces virginiae]|uniref:hypothetical protein n=1 Tax=Streptomyces virginiae TaxID=1961 RepID=UPI00365BB590
MWEAFDITLGQARFVSRWAGLGFGGSVSDERLESELGRLVPRVEDLDFGVLDRGRETFHRPRTMTLIGDHHDLPLRFAREFSIHSYSDHFGLLVLRGGAEAVAEMNEFVSLRSAPSFERVLLSDGNGAARPVGSVSVERVERRGVSEHGVIVGLG